MGDLIEVPVGAVLKKDGEGNIIEKMRTVENYSFPKNKRKVSINDGASKEEKICDFPKHINVCQFTEIMNYIGKFDWSEAFRQIKLHLNSRHLTTVRVR